MKSHLGTVTLILAFILTSAAIAQPAVDWLRTYGGDGMEYFRDVCQTQDGGFMIAGAVDNNGFVLVKTNSDGIQEWTRTYGGAVMRFCGWVRPAVGGGYFCAGAVSDTNRRDDLVVQKIAANGDPQWRFVLDGGWATEISSAQATPDGGCIVGGFASSFTTKALLLKVTASGDSEWVREYGGTNWDKCMDVLNAPGGGYYLVGSRIYEEDDPPWRLWVMRLSDNGEIAWSRTYSFPYRPEFNAAHVTSDGGLAVAGIDYEARRLDWYMGSRVLVRIDPDGHRLWTRTYMTYDCMTVTGLDVTNDGGYILAGERGMLRLNANGDSLWCMPTVSEACMQLADNSFLLAGVTGIDQWDLFLMKTVPEELAANVPTAVIPGSITLLPNFPNPFNAVTTIRFDLPRAGNANLTVFDMNGRVVQSLTSGQYPAGSHEIRFDGGDLPSGIYFCRLNVGNYSATQKMVLLK